MTEIYPIRHAQTEGSRFPVHQGLLDGEEPQAALFSPAEDRAYYERCYADAWMFSHGDLRGFSAATYYTAACRHHGQQPGSVLRIWLHGEPAGLVDLDPVREAENKAGWVSLLYLEPAFRGKGHGLQLLERADRFYRLQGRQSLRLLVAESNRTARAFYEREGFRRIGEENGSTGKLLRLERLIPAAGEPG
jgi:probable phosphoglycerate mutase